MTSYNNFLSKHKDRILKIAETNTPTDTDGHVMLSKDDPWIQDTVWDDYVKVVKSYEENKSRNTTSRSLVSVG